MHLQFRKRYLNNVSHLNRSESSLSISSDVSAPSSGASTPLLRKPCATHLRDPISDGTAEVGNGALAPFLWRNIDNLKVTQANHQLHGRNHLQRSDSEFSIMSESGVTERETKDAVMLNFAKDRTGRPKGRTFSRPSRKQMHASSPDWLEARSNLPPQPKIE